MTGDLTKRLQERVARLEVEDPIELALKSELTDLALESELVGEDELTWLVEMMALPHWFDRPMLDQMLPDTMKPDPKMDLVGESFDYVGALLDLPFVGELPRPAGLEETPPRFEIDKAYRAHLLRRWQAPERREELVEFSRRFRDYFRRLHRQADDFERLTLEREALYHQFVANEKEALKRFRTLFEQAESAYQFGICQVLVNLAREQEPLFQDSTTTTAWVRYYQGRLHVLLGEWDEAHEILTGLLENDSLDRNLAARARLSLGKAETGLGHWTTAIKHYKQSLEHFQKTGDERRKGTVMLEIGNAYADFALNSRLDYQPRYRHPRFARLLKYSGPLREPALQLGFVLSQLFLFAFFLPIAAYLLWKSSGHLSIQHMSRYYDWPLIPLVVRALEWYGRAEQATKDEGLRAETQFRLARLLQQFGNPQAAAKIYRVLENNPTMRDNEYQTAILNRELARIYLGSGEVESAMPLLAASLATFQRYDDKPAIAETLALRARGKLLTEGPAAALDDYRKSVKIYQAINARLPVGKLVEEIEQLQDRRGIPNRKALGRSLLEALGVSEDDRIYFSRQTRPLTGWILASGLMPYLIYAVLWGFFFLTLEDLLPTIDSIGGFMMMVIASSIPGVWLATLVASLIATRLIRMETLERRRPGFVVLDAKQIAWVGFDGRVERTVRWSDVTGVLSREEALWRKPEPELSSLEIYAGRDTVFEISGYTSRYQQLRTQIRHWLEAQPGSQVAWRAEHTSPRSLKGCAEVISGLVLGALIGFAGIVLLFSAVFIALRAASVGTLAPLMFGAFIQLLAVAGTWWALQRLGRVHAMRPAMRPERQIPLFVLIAGALLLALYFVVPVIQSIGRPFSFVLVGVGYWWIIQAGLWILRPRHLVHARQIETTQRLAARGKSLLAIGLLIGAAALLSRFLATDLSEYYYLVRYLAADVTDEPLETQEQYLSQAMHLKPDDPWAYYWHADVRYRQGRYNEAIEDATVGLAVVQGSPPIIFLLHFARGDAYFSLGEYKQALADYRLVREKGAESFARLEWSSLKREARTLARLGMLPEAEAALMAWTPQTASDYYERGASYYELGKYPLALADFEMALGRARARSSYVYAKARALDAMERHADALETIAQVEPKKANQFRNRGVVYTDLREFDLAEKDFQQAGELDEAADNLSNLARLYNNQGRYEDALTAAEQSIALDPELASAHSHRGVALANLGQVAQGLEEANAALELYPRYVRGHYNRALIYAMMGQDELAIADLEWVLREWEFDDMALWEIENARKLLAELEGE